MKTFWSHCIDNILDGCISTCTHHTHSACISLIVCVSERVTGILFVLVKWLSCVCSVWRKLPSECCLGHSRHMAYWFLVVRSAVQAPFKISIEPTSLSTAASRKLGKLHIHHRRYFKILWKHVGPEEMYVVAGVEHTQWLSDWRFIRAESCIKIHKTLSNTAVGSNSSHGGVNRKRRSFVNNCSETLRGAAYCMWICTWSLFWLDFCRLEINDLWEHGLQDNFTFSNQKT